MTDLAAWAKPATAGAADRGFQAWNFDVIAATGSGNNTAGTVFGARLQRYAGGVVSSLHFLASGAGASLVPGNFAGIYSPAGVLLAQTADLTTLFGSVAPQTLVTCPLTAPVALAAGFYDVALLFNQSGGLVPQVMRVTSQTGQARGLGVNGAALRNWTADTGRTTLPAVLGAKSEKTPAEWMAIS